MKKARIFLSRRNLEVLLSKLDRQAAGKETTCTIIKYKNAEDPPEFMQQFDEIMITAIENGEYYRARPAGRMHPADGPRCAPVSAQWGADESVETTRAIAESFDKILERNKAFYQQLGEEVGVFPRPFPTFAELDLYDDNKPKE